MIGASVQKTLFENNLDSAIHLGRQIPRDTTISNLSKKAIPIASKTKILESYEEESIPVPEISIGENLLGDSEAPEELLRAFTHIHSDSILKDTEYEGNNLFKTSAMMRAFLSQYQQRPGHLVPSSAEKGIDDIINMLQCIEKDDNDFQFLMDANISAEERKKRIQSRAQGIARTIKELPQGSSYIMNGGWTDRPCGHAMLYEFIKRKDNNYDLVIYNTGSGTENCHDILFLDGKQKIRPIKKIENVTPQQLFLDDSIKEKTLFEELLRLRIPAELSCGDIRKGKPNAQSIYEVIFGHLQDNPSSPVDQSTAGFMTAQRSGTCAWRVLTAFLHYKLNDKAAYKLIKNELKFQTMVEFDRRMEEHLVADTVIGDQARTVLKDAAKKFLRSTAKLYEPENAAKQLVGEEDVKIARAVASCMIKKIETAEQTIGEARRAKIFQVDCEATIQSEWKQLLAKIQRQNKGNVTTIASLSLTKTVFPNPIKPIPADLLPELQKAQKLVESQDSIYNEQTKLYIEAFIRNLPVPGTIEGIEYWKNVPEADVLKCMEFLNALLSKYNTCFNEVTFPEEVATAGVVYAVQVCLALRYDEERRYTNGQPNSYWKDPKLSDYSFQCMGALQHLGRPAIFFHPEAHTQYTNAVNYLLNRRTNDHPSFFCCGGALTEKNSQEGELKYFCDMLHARPQLGKKVGQHYKNFPPEAVSQFNENTKKAIHLAAEVNTKGIFSEEGLSHLIFLKRSALINRNLAPRQHTNLGNVIRPNLEWIKRSHSLELDFWVGDVYASNSLQNFRRMHHAEGLYSWAMRFNFFQNREANILLRDDQVPFITPSLLDKKSGGKPEKEEANQKEEATYRPSLPLGDSELKEILLTYASVDDRYSQEMTPQHLLRVFQDNCDKFSDPEVRTFFELLFFYQDEGRSYWVEELRQQEKYPSNILIEQCAAFVAQGLQMQTTSSKRDLFTSLFFIRFAQRIGLWTSDKTWSTSFLSILDNMLTTLVAPPLTSIEKRAIHLHRITHYANVTFMTDEDYARMAESWVYVKNFPRGNNQECGGPEMEAWASQIFFKHLPQIKNTFKNNGDLRNQTLTKIMRSVGVFSQDVQQEWEGPLEHPHYICNFGGAIYTIDLPKGMIHSSQDGELAEEAMIPDSLSITSQYKRIFNKKHLCRKFGDTLSFIDTVHGPIRILPNHRIQRQFQVGNKMGWYQNVSVGHLSALPNALLADHSHWISSDKPPHLIIADNASGKPAYVLLENGDILSWEEWEKLQFNFQPVNSVTLHEMNLSQLQNFEGKQGYILLAKQNGKSKQMTFTRYRSLAGKSLHFDISGEGKVIWEENKQFCLEKQQKGLLGSCSNYLLLTNHKGNKQKLLVPIQQVIKDQALTNNIHLDVQDVEREREYKQKSEIDSEQQGVYRFLEFDVDRGEIVASNVEGRLFLAYLFLAQRDYRTALKYLEQITQTDSLSQQSMDIVESILDGMIKDESPNAVAIRLQTVRFMTEDLVKKFKKNVVKDYQSYKSNQNNIDAAIQLSAEHEEELKNVFPRLAKNLDNNIIRSYTRSGKKRRAIQNVYFNTKAYTSYPHHFDYFMNPNKSNDPSKTNIPYKEITKRFLEFYGYAKSGTPLQKQWLRYKLDHLLSMDSSEQWFFDILEGVLKSPEKMPDPFGGSSDQQRWEWCKKIDEAGAKLDPIPAEETQKSYSEFSAKGSSITFPLKKIKKSSPILISPSARPPESSLNLSPIMNSYLEQEKSSTTAAEAPHVLRQIEKDELTKGDKCFYEAIQTELNAFNDDLALGRELNRQNIVFKLKDDESVDHLIAALEQQATTFKETSVYEDWNLEELEKNIKKLANTRNANPAIALRESLLIDGYVETALTLEQIISLYLRKDPNVYVQANPNLHRQSLSGNNAYEVLDQMISCYLQSYTKLQQLERCISWANKVKEASHNPLEQKGLIQQLAGELESKRNYTPGGSKQERAFLVFEYQSNMLLREKQCELISSLLTKNKNSDSNKYKNLVVQLIMGGGKTAVLASILLILAAAERDSLALFVTPAAQFESVKENLRNTQKKYFGQDIAVIDVQRADLTEGKLKEIRNTLIKTRAKKQLLMMKKETIKMLQLQWIFLLFRHYESGGKSEQSEEIHILRDILLEFKKHGQVLLDEVDMLLDIHFEVNLPDGDSEAVKTSHIDLFKEIFTCLTNETLEPIVGLRSNKQILLSEQVFQEKVKPAIIEHLAKYAPLAIDQNNQKQFTRFLRGEMEPILQVIVDQKNVKSTIEELNNNIRDSTHKIEELEKEIASLKVENPAQPEKCKKALLSLEEEKAWLESQKKNYAILATITGETGRFPIGEAISPAVMSTYLEDLTFLTWLKEKSTSSDEEEVEAVQLISLTKYILDDLLPVCLQKQCGRNFGRSKNLQMQGQVIPYLGVDTPATTLFGNHLEAICYHFMTCLAEGISEGQVAALATNFKTFASYFSEREGEVYKDTAEAQEFQELTGVDLHLMDQPTALEQATKNINAYLNKDVSKILDMESETVAQYVTWHKRRFSSTPLSFVNMFASVRGFSGTPWNYDSFEESLATNIQMDSGSEGTIFDVLLNRLDKKQQQMHVVGSITPDGLLKEVLTNHARKNDVRGIIDSGAVFTGISNVDVAQKILDLLLQLPENTMDGVLFFHRFPMDSSKPHLLVEQLAVLKKNERGEPFITIIGGTRLEDIAKKADLTKLFVYYDERHTTGTDIPQLPNAINLMTIDPGVLQRNIGQGMLRLRQYFLGQDVEFVIPQATQMTLLNQGKTMADILKSAIKNQAIRKAEDTYKSYKAKIEEIMRNAAIQKLLSITDQKQQMNDFGILAPFLITENADDPYQQYGKLAGEKLTIKSLEDMCAHYKNIATGCFSESESKKIGNALDSLLKRAKESSFLQKHIKEKNSTALGIEQELQTEMNVEQEVEMNTEQQMEIDWNLYTVPGMHCPRNEDLWSDSDIENTFIKPSQLAKGESLCPLQDIFKNGPNLEGNVKEFYISLGAIFDDNIFVTKNFQYTARTLLPIFHKSQKRGHQILAIKKDGHMQFVLLTKGDAKAMREWMQKSEEYKAGKLEMWLLQPNGKLLEGHPKGPPLQEDDAHIQRMLIQVNAINGNAQYLRAHTPATNLWINETPLLEITKSDFIMMATHREGIKTKQAQIAQRSAFLETATRWQTSKKNIKKCKKRREEEEIKRLGVTKLKDEEIAVMDPKLVRYLSKNQVPKLKTADQCKALLPRQVAFISPEQIRAGLLREQNYRYLTSEEQLQAIDAALDPNTYLTEEQVKKGLCNEDQLNRLDNPRLVAAIPGRQVHLIHEDRIHLLSHPMQIRQVKGSVRIMRISPTAEQYISRDQIKSLLDTAAEFKSKDASSPEYQAIDTFLKIYVDRLPSEAKSDILNLMQTYSQKTPIKIQNTPNLPNAPQTNKKPPQANPSTFSTSTNRQGTKIEKTENHSILEKVRAVLQRFWQQTKSMLYIFYGYTLSAIAILTGVYFLRHYPFFGNIWRFCQRPIIRIS